MTVADRGRPLVAALAVVLTLGAVAVRAEATPGAPTLAPTVAPALPPTLPSPLSAARVSVAILNQKCDTNADMARLAEQVRSGHAVAGTWTLHAVFTCAEAEQALSVNAVLSHGGKPLLTSAAGCTSTTLPACTRAAGAVRTARLGSSVRGTYVIHVTVTLTGPDAILVQGCEYDAPTLTATCRADSAPIVVR